MCQCAFSRHNVMSSDCSWLQKPLGYVVSRCMVCDHQDTVELKGRDIIVRFLIH